MQKWFFTLSLLLSSYAQADLSLQTVLKLGKRNLDWAQTLGVQMWDISTIRTYTPDKPFKSSPELLAERYESAKNEIPSSYWESIEGKGNLPKSNPYSPEEFVKYARIIDGLYQEAGRLQNASEDLNYFKSAQAMDVRGYLAFQNLPSAENLLLGWDKIINQEQWKKNLTSLCMNSNQPLSYCQAKLEKAIRNGNQSIVNFYEQYIGVAKQRYESYFKIANKRNDLQWKNSTNLPFAFNSNTSLTLQNWLIKNIEAMWQWGDYQIKLSFNSSAKTAIHFQEGVAPYAMGLGGNEIVLDPNRPLDETINTLAIKHEFGHLLGFPDCYVEFFDESEQVMVYYQLDLNNIMCSLTGKALPLHLTEIKRAYFR